MILIKYKVTPKEELDILSRLEEIGIMPTITETTDLIVITPRQGLKIRNKVEDTDILLKGQVYFDSKTGEDLGEVNYFKGFSTTPEYYNDSGMSDSGIIYIKENPYIQGQCYLQLFEFINHVEMIAKSAHNDVDFEVTEFFKRKLDFILKLGLMTDSESQLTIHDVERVRILLET